MIKNHDPLCGYSVKRDKQFPAVMVMTIIVVTAFIAGSVMYGSIEGAQSQKVQQDQQDVMIKLQQQNDNLRSK